MAHNMKKSFIAIVSSLIISLAGCSYIKENPEFVKNILNIGLRVAVYALIQKNPGIEPHVADIAKFMEDPVLVLEPDSLRWHLENLISGTTRDEVYTQSLNELKDMIVAFYQDVYDKNAYFVPQSEMIKIVQAMGKTMRSALNPAVTNTTAWQMETPGYIIVVE